MFFIKKITIIFSCILCIFLQNYAVAQNYNFKNYNTEQGLAQSQVTSIFQDSDRNMWFGTNSGGVSKFNGSKFYNYNTNNGLLSNFVFSVSENKSKEIIFGTDKGVSVLKGNKFTNYNQLDNKLLPQIFSTLNENNRIWIGTEKGVYQFENNKIKKFVGNELLNNSTVLSMVIDNTNRIWFATTQNGVICFNASSKQFTSYNKTTKLCDDYVFSLAQDSDGKMLIGTTGGLNTIDAKGNVDSIRYIKHQFNIGFRSLVSKTHTGNWYGTSGEGLYRYENKVLTNYNSENGLTNNTILSLYEDQEKNIWIGTDGEGVFKYSGDRFVSYSTKNGLEENYINAVAVDYEGNYFLGLRFKGITKISGKTNSHYKADFVSKNSLPDNNVNTILTASDGKLYMGTQEGFCVYENNRFKLIENSNFKQQYILSLYEDSEKNIWIGTANGAFVMKDNIINEVAELNKQKKGEVPLTVYNFIEDKNGQLFISTTEGLYTFRSNMVVRVPDIKSLVLNSVKDFKNNLWFGTEEGLYFYNYNAFTKFSQTNDALANTINLLQVDNYRRLIVGTNTGLEAINLNDYYNNKTTIKHFSKEDGLIGLESNFNASCKDRLGRILIGTTNGLEIYDPRLDTKNNIESKTKITSAKLFFGQENIFKYSGNKDSSLILPEHLKLPFNKNHITFHFVGVSLTAPEKVFYKYKLDGLDEDWSPETNKTEATYSSLQPGTYKFLVKSCNNDGLWNKEAVAYEFEVLAPWYKTWWFYTLCVIVLISAISLYNYYNTKKLIADKQKLEQVVSIRTSELRSEKEKVEVINKEVIEQKSIIEHKNVEMMDSIKYAKNIQEALLPNLNEVNHLFENNFILYMPKDIVSGDFYWFAKQGDTSYMASVDCTGHGVPGAFLSIVGSNFLKQGHVWIGWAE